jgi:septal ring factor EnvC (AmiA/AmiB activator)
VSWESLDRTQKQTREEIDPDLDGMDKSLNKIEKIQNNLAQWRVRLARNRKALSEAENRAKAKASCLLAELEEQKRGREKNDGFTDCELAENSSAFSSFLDAADVLGQMDWSASGALDGTPERDDDTFQSSGRVPRYFPLTDILPT